MGISKVIKTISSIKHYASMISKLEKWLNSELV